MNTMRLKEILGLKRGHGSIGERKLVENILLPYKPTPYLSADMQVAAYVITTDPASKILWSCHIDTVHPIADDARQVVIWDDAQESTMTAYKQDNAPLGADDGAGVWLLLEMIDMKVPGTYIFHRGEERGGIGSKAMAAQHSAFLSGFTHAIAFDRRDTCSVITHQASRRCCSQPFALQLSAKLSSPFYEIKPDSGGIYTDTREYTGLIGECTNVSVGYYNEHTGSEMLDLQFLYYLRDKMISTDFSTLVSERKAGEVDPADDNWWEGYYDRYGYGSQSSYKGNVTSLPKLGKKSKAKAKTSKRGYAYDEEVIIRDHTDVLNVKFRDLRRWTITAAPEDVADLLLTMAEEIAALEREIDMLQPLDIEDTDTPLEFMTGDKLFQDDN